MSITPELKTKLVKIRQGTHTWQCTVRRAPLWITPKNEPAYRPYIIMVLNIDTDKILKTEIVREPPDAGELLMHLAKAMQGSFVPPAPKGRPARISIDHAELLTACAPHLAELGIRCDFRPSMTEINEALWSMEAHMNKRQPMPGLLTIPGVSLPLVTELYSAAEDFFQKAPWRWIANWLPIEIHYPADGIARYALILGQGGEVYGLSLYTSLADIARILDRHDFKKPLDPPINWISLVFSEVTMMHFEDLDAIEQYEFPIASEQAYPLLIKASNDDFSNLPTAADVAWMAATLRTLPNFLTQQMQVSPGTLREAHATLPLPNMHGGQQLALRFPALEADGSNPIDRLVDPQLDTFIEDWEYSEKTYPFAREIGRFLLDFIDSLDGLSRQTINKHERNCWYIGWLACKYGKFKTFSPEIFLGAPRFLAEFKRNVSHAESAVQSYAVTWRKLEKYAITRIADDGLR